ncbi:MAG: hypothetical protein ACKOD3_05495, partial [Phenylobacterium sp.]
GPPMSNPIADPLVEGVDSDATSDLVRLDTTYVVAAIGPRAARGLFASARTFDADEALRLGLVSELVEDAPALAAAADRIAGEAMACAPGAIAASKALVDAVAWREIDQALMEDTARRIAQARVSVEGRWRRRCRG